MSSVFLTADQSQLLAGLRAARQAVARGEVVVLPTDTVYGVGADAFTPSAVTRLLEAKGRGRDKPPPVLVGSKEAMTALVDEVPSAVTDLMDAFWPGGLTIVLPARTGLVWDLGDTRGTVAVRMPDHAIAIELLLETGPMAVSSANATGEDAATTADAAQAMLGDAVSVYLDGGPSTRGVASTIVDCTLLVTGADLGERSAPVVRVLREGAVSREQLGEVLGELLEDPSAAPSPSRTAPIGRELSAEEVPEGISLLAYDPSEAPTVRTEPLQPAPRRHVPSSDTGDGSGA